MKRVFFFFVLLMSPAVHASCGLSVCDVPAREGGVWGVESRVSRVVYDFDAAKGSYIQTSVAVDYAGFSGWRLGGMFPVVSHSPDAGHSKTGLGNPVLRGEKVFGVWGVGTMWELPFGHDEHGLASDHVAAIPYAAWRPVRGAWSADVRGGYCRSFSDGHGGNDHGQGGHGHSRVLVVNPHEDQELVFRGALTRSAGKAVFGGVVEGQQPLDGATKNKLFLTGGLSADVRWGGGWSGGILFDVPLSRPRRFEERWALRLAKSF